MGKWANKYLGSQWLLGGNGKGGYDCYGLVRAVQKEVFNRELPELSELASMYNKDTLREVLSDKEVKNNWELSELNKAVSGDCIMLLNRKNVVNHVGVIIVGSREFKVLHSLERVGVIVSSIYELYVESWNVKSCYKWVGVEG